MPLLDEFVGGTYKALSLTAAADLAVNVYPETRRADGSAKTKWLYGTPGQRAIAEGSGNACRGWFSQDGRTWVLLGINLYEFDANNDSLTLIGTLPDNGEPMSAASNGKGGDQVLFAGGDVVKVFDLSTNILSAAITLPFTGPVTACFLDGYFLINQRNSPTFWFSAIEDGTSWDALDFIARSGSSDNLVAIASTQDRIWAWGTETTTLFYDSGDADTPFLPYPGTTTQIGAVTPWAIARNGDVFTWLAQGGNQARTIVKATGTPAPTTVSTPPIEQWLKGCTTLAGCEALAYADVGHAFTSFTCMNSPEDVQTYVWDDIEQQWHARAGWDATAGVFTRWRPRGVCQIGGRVLVGAYDNAVMSVLDAAAYADNGVPLVRLRRMPYVSDETSTFIFIDEIELVGQVAVGLVTGQGASPLADLRISRDAAHSWISAGGSTLGEMGNALARTIWRFLGRVRPDRLVIEISQSDPVAVTWLGLRLRSSAGTGQL